jgi:hypothetical protein
MASWPRWVHFGSIRRPHPPLGSAIWQLANVYLTRLHVRYDAAHFPEDLIFQETTDRSNFQGRYVLRHPYTGPITCAEGEAYRRSLGPRFETLQDSHIPTLVSEPKAFDTVDEAIKAAGHGLGAWWLIVAIPAAEPCSDP